MFKLFLKKEKNHMFRILPYLLLLAIYISLAIEKPTEDFGYEWAIIVMYIVFEVVFKTFQITPFFRNTYTYKFYPSFRPNLKMLSLSLRVFIKYNLIYGYLKLIPFLIIYVIFQRDIGNLYVILTFFSLITLINISSPLRQIEREPLSKLYIESSEKNNIKYNELVKSYNKDKYPNINSHVINFFRGTYSFGYMFIIICVNGLFVNTILTYHLRIILYILGVLGLVIFLSSTIFYVILFKRYDYEV